MLNDPHESHQRIERYSKNDGDEAFFAALNRTLADAALPLQVNSNVDIGALPIIYIVGAPRSGTTLLSQLLSRYLPVGYIDNLIARFWQRPSVGIRLSRSLLGNAGREAIAFDSKHGVTQGVEGPHEFGYFWRQWLALDGAETHKLSNREAEAIDGVGLKRALENEILKEFGAPVVFKNVICGFQAEILSRVHPASLFVWIRREPEDVVRSILKCRMERYGRYDAWWSLKPSTYPLLVKIESPVRQVLGQVMDCMREFEQELSKPGVRSLTVEYSDLVNRPDVVLAEVCEAVKSLGFEMSPLRKELPVFREPRKVRLPDNLEEELDAVFACSTRRSSLDVHST